MQNSASVININTSLIIPNKYQPRKVFDEKELNSLAESIKKYGIINPILVRKKEDKYEIIAGERRFRAAKLLGLNEVPVIVKNANEQQMAELALIENLHRQELSPIEEAKSYEEIMRIGNQTQESLAKTLGKSQSAIANKIRLLSLPEEIQTALANKKISERHARSLINVSDKEKQLELLNRIISEKLTVKETENIIKEKEINDDEIKQAISDIMKSLNIKEEEKEDDNMNNGNFFPNFDNNNAANNNASLNMMNMQSMNQQPPINPEPEMVMPTQVSPQQGMPNSAPQMNPFEQFGPVSNQVNSDFNMNNVTQNFEPMLGAPTMNGQVEPPIMPTIEPPVINENPIFGPSLNQPTNPVDMSQPTSMPQLDEPLFNPNATMTLPEMPVAQPAPELGQSPVEEPLAPPFEIPVVSAQPTNEEPPVALDKLTQLQDFLNANGFAFKTYSNETDNCVVVEFPKN